MSVLQGKVRKLKGCVHEVHTKYAATADQLERNGLLRALARFLTSDPWVMSRHTQAVRELEELVRCIRA